MFRLLYHPDVPVEDLVVIPRNLQQRIARAIERRLTTVPERAGTPLRGTLRGYWKLPIDDYRVAYTIHKMEVWVFAIRHRRSVYTDVLPRLSE